MDVNNLIGEIPKEYLEAVKEYHDKYNEAKTVEEKLEVIFAITFMHHIKMVSDVLEKETNK